MASATSSAEFPPPLEGGGLLRDDRRVFLFQSPLSFLEVLQTASTSPYGVSVNPNIDWDDNADLSQTESIPHILTAPFNIFCHIGVVVIKDTVCDDTSLTLAEKLLHGKVYEHAGKIMRSSREAEGKPMKADFVRRIAALDYVGHTDMSDELLNRLLQNIIRVDRDLDCNPPYRPIYWNCHDVACRFAYLAIRRAEDAATIQDLSGIFERAKFGAQRTLDSYVMEFIHLSSIAFARLTTYILLTTPTAVIDPVNSSFRGVAATREFVESVRYYWSSIQTRNAVLAQALRDRIRWSDILKGRFPILNDLNHVANHEWERLIPLGLWESICRIWITWNADDT